MLKVSLNPPWGGANGFAAMVRVVWEQPSQDGTAWVEKEDSSRHGDPSDQWAYAVRSARVNRERSLDRRNVRIQARVISEWQEVESWEDAEALAQGVVGVVVDSSSSDCSASNASPTPTTPDGSTGCSPSDTDLSSCGATPGWMLVVGNPIDGLTLFGPFASEEEAITTAESRVDYDQWTMTQIERF